MRHAKSQKSHRNYYISLKLIINEVTFAKVNVLIYFKDFEIFQLC